MDSSKIFLGGTKVVKFVFSHSKLRKQPCFAEIFKIKGVPWRLPSDARGSNSKCVNMAGMYIFMYCSSNLS